MKMGRGEKLECIHKGKDDAVERLGEDGWCPACRSNLMMQGEPHWYGTSQVIESAMCRAADRLRLKRGIQDSHRLKTGLNIVAYSLRAGMTICLKQQRPTSAHLRTLRQFDS